MGLFQSTFEMAAIEYHRAYQLDNVAAKMAAQQLLEKITKDWDVGDVAMFLKHVNDVASGGGKSDGYGSIYTAWDVVNRLRHDSDFCRDFSSALHLDKAALATFAGMLSATGKK